jgi:hypothetical protein
MADIKLSFVNASNDANNSQVVIFQQNEEFPSEIVSAWHVEQVEPGKEVSVSVKEHHDLYLAIAENGKINAAIVRANELLSPPVAIKAGQTAYIAGNPDSGYTITIKG